MAKLPFRLSIMLVAERPADQPRRVRVLHQTGCGRNRAGDSDADRAARAHLALDVAHEIDDGRQRVGVAVTRRRHPPPQAHTPIVVYRDALDLGAAEIDADPHGLTSTLNRFCRPERSEGPHRRVLRA